jgi:UDP-glucuronate 4-epimerase
MIRVPISVLVTGSSGFIGTNLVRHLREAGHLVTGIDIRPPGQPLPDGTAFHKCDIRTDPFPPGRFDAVVHLAALPGVRQSLHDPESYRRTNVDGTVRLLAFCRSAGIPRFVFASSSSVYGPETPLPAREDGPVDPCSP